MPHDLSKLDLSHHSGSRGFVVVFLATFVGGYLLFVAVNVLGNRTNLFPSPLHPARSERAWKTRRIEAMVREGKAPEVIILGSSRVMQIRPEYVAKLAGGRTFNYGVSAANPVDWYAQTGYLLSHGAKPKMIILGVDEFCFGEATSHWQVQTFGNFELAKQQPWPEGFFALGSLLQNVAPYDTWKSFLSSFRKEDDAKILVSKSEFVLPDGYMIYRSIEEQMKAGKFDARTTARKNAGEFLRKNAAGTVAGLELTPRREQLFCDVLDRCRSAGVEVRVMLLPLQPEYARLVMRGHNGRLGQIWQEVADWLAKTCPQHGAKFWDFRYPKTYGGDPNGFWDGQHQTSENDRRMMNVMFGLPPEKLARDFPDDLTVLNAALASEGVSRRSRSKKAESPAPATTQSGTRAGRRRR